jgi:hypothetical protein
MKEGFHGHSIIIENNSGRLIRQPSTVKQQLTHSIAIEYPSQVPVCYPQLGSRACAKNINKLVFYNGFDV